MDKVYTTTIEKLMVEAGGSCVWLCNVIEALRAEGHQVTLEEFAQWAFEAHASYRVTLRSYGMVDAMWVAQVVASEVRSPSGAVYHTITRP
jgi:hypothetical protein